MGEEDVLCEVFNYTRLRGRSGVPEGREKGEGKGRATTRDLGEIC